MFPLLSPFACSRLFACARLLVIRQLWFVNSDPRVVRRDGGEFAPRTRPPLRSWRVLKLSRVGLCTVARAGDGEQVRERGLGQERPDCDGRGARHVQGGAQGAAQGARLHALLR
eukprot:6000358-Pleurochrysis_carterae.AAC.1